MLPSPFLDATHCPGIVALSPIEQQHMLGALATPAVCPHIVLPPEVACSSVGRVIEDESLALF